jgi:hypothetical protein
VAARRLLGALTALSRSPFRPAGLRKAEDRRGSCRTGLFVVPKSVFVSFTCWPGNRPCWSPRRRRTRPVGRDR